MPESYTRSSRAEAKVGAYGSLNGGFVEEVPVKATTTDATATTIFSIPLALLEACILRVTLAGVKGDITAAAGIFMTGLFRRQAAGNVTQVGATAGTIVEDSAGTPVIAFFANTTLQTIEVRVTGIAAETWRWEGKVERLKVA